VPILNFGGIQIDKSLYIQDKGMDYQTINNKVKEKIKSERRMGSQDPDSARDLDNYYEQQINK
jgi:hypothetical protein